MVEDSDIVEAYFLVDALDECQTMSQVNPLGAVTKLFVFIASRESNDQVPNNSKTRSRAKQFRAGVEARKTSACRISKGHRSLLDTTYRYEHDWTVTSYDIESQDP